MESNQLSFTTLPVMDYILLQFKLMQSRGCTSEGYEVYSNIFAALSGVKLGDPSVSYRDHFDLCCNGVEDFMRSVPEYNSLLQLIKECSHVVLVFENGNLLETIKISISEGIDLLDKYIDEEDETVWKKVKLGAYLDGSFVVPRKAKYAKSKNKMFKGYLAYSEQHSIVHTNISRYPVCLKRTSLTVYTRMRKW